MLEIRTLAPGQSAASQRWDEFVMACPTASFFHRAGWQRIMGEVFRHKTHFLYAQSQGRIQGVLPLAHVHSLLFGNALVGLPFAVYGGVAALTPQAAAALEDEAQRIARRLGVAHLELRNTSQRNANWPMQDIYVTFRKALFEKDDDNLQAIPRKQRAMVRRGIKNGLVSAIDPGLDRFFALYADNMLRHGTPALPMRYFKALQAEFGSDCEVLTVSTSQGQALSSVLSFYFRDEVLPYYAGDAVAARALAANDLKYWELMRRACQRGSRVFDYGRSKRGTGSFAFKKNWGFEPQALHYEYCLYKRDTVPQNNPANPRYRRLIEAWRRMPAGLANWLGPILVRNLG